MIPPATPSPSAPKPSRQRQIGGLEFILLMGLLQALQALAVDSMLPALGTMAVDLGARDPNQRQLVVGIFLICSGLGCLLPGTLADRYGRRPVLITCLTSYILCSTACALVTNFDQLLVLRAILGVACAGLMVLPAAIIRDRHEGDAMARLQSTVGIVFMVVPMIAPSVGQAVLLVASWRWIFGVMALLGSLILFWMATRLPETLRPEFKQPIAPRKLAMTMGAIITTRSAAGYVLGMALIQGAMFGYINSSQQLVAEHFGAGARFPLIFAGMAACMACSNFTNSRIVEKFGARRVSHTALLIYIGTSALQFYIASQPNETLWEFVPMMTVNMCLLGFLGSNFTSIALQPFARSAGAAASAQSFIRMVLASCLGSMVGQAFDGTARPLAFALMVAGLGCLVLVLFSEKGRLFRRLLPPGTPRPIA
ncbi:MFS transporter [Novosphingobium umbonatum]|uniref:MFS transporter n=1 Tax=Novosphingobium umbonatum TaxID=1908524 RepID=A0A437NDG3_9SPHN|nr:multidrug effflux MFS transporter [Novosphingobium umbonatum]RVU07896.1 MFS transporter [Novosphingobium umbonatum]